MSARLFFVFALIIPILTGCKDRGYLQDANVQHLTGATDIPYLLDSGDRLRVNVFGQENLSGVYGVDGGGFISLPLVGAVKASGITTFELANQISAELRRKYIRDPKVTVEVSTYRPFFVLGEVRAAGQYSYVNGMTAQTAVAIAGGYSPRANEGNVEITRTVGGHTETRTVPPTYPVLPGDTVYVTERFF